MEYLEKSVLCLVHYFIPAVHNYTKLRFHVNHGELKPGGPGGPWPPHF